MMRRQHLISADLAHHLTQRAIPRSAGLRLEIAGGNVDVKDAVRNTKLLT